MKKIFFILLLSGCTLFDDDNETSQEIFVDSELKALENYCNEISVFPPRSLHVQ